MKTEENQNLSLVRDAASVIADHDEFISGGSSAFFRLFPFPL
jgi:hypothetical protein